MQTRAFWRLPIPGNEADDFKETLTLSSSFYIFQYFGIYMRMALSIKDPEADRLARQVARITGETLTGAIVQSLRERLVRVQRRRGPGLADELLTIGNRCANLPVLDERTADEILGYDDSGLPR